jgi:hypothetical protein
VEKRQVGDWKVFEDECFMVVIVSVLGDRFKVGSVGAYRVEGLDSQRIAGCWWQEKKENLRK